VGHHAAVGPVSWQTARTVARKTSSRCAGGYGRPNISPTVRADRHRSSTACAAGNSHVWLRSIRAGFFSRSSRSAVIRTDMMGTTGPSTGYASP
jgi:hypothetical protein